MVRHILIFFWSIVLLGIPATRGSVIVNGDFELGGFVPNSDNAMSLVASSTTMTGWTVIGDSLVWISTPNPFSLQAKSGTKFLDLTDYAQGGPFGGVRQSINTITNAVYQISFDVGAVSGTSRIQVTANNLSDIASSSASNGHTWTTYSSFFTAGSSSTTIEFIGNQADGGGHYIGLDNVKVELFHNPNPVPEPSCCFLLMFSVLPGMRSMKKLLR